MGSSGREQGRKGRAGARAALPPAAWRCARLCPEGEQPQGAPRAPPALLPRWGLRQAASSSGSAGSPHRLLTASPTKPSHALLLPWVTCLLPKKAEADPNCTSKLPCAARGSPKTFTCDSGPGSCNQIRMAPG